ncbi:MAG TPA: beta-1,6-N-acetylglucosaminyltransferase [Allosphingosinicella sp.]|uniref:beta-1,6-N-acetylglucosaminyltransferase n=1 Tax=Allosphingosinicella sp. TaxID=2823234 RepID=UPI002F295ABF
MRMAYLILAHRDMDQLGALVTRLLRDDSEDRVVIHYDRGSPVSDEELQGFANRFGGAVSLTPRVRCLWGHHSQVEAEWLLKKAATKLPVDCAHLISGQDWPVASKAAMIAGIDPDVSYVSFETPDLTERMDDYHFHDRILGPNPHPTAYRYHLDMNLRRAARLYTRLRGPRTCPLGPSWKKGSAWWSLPKQALDYAVPRIGSLIDTGRVRHTLCGDEHVIHTVMAYSPFAARMAENRRFIRWKPGTSNPELLREADEPAMRASDAWFARKVDRNVDPFFLKL